MWRGALCSRTQRATRFVDRPECDSAGQKTAPHRFDQGRKKTAKNGSRVGQSGRGSAPPGGGGRWQREKKIENSPTGQTKRQRFVASPDEGGGFRARGPKRVRAATRSPHFRVGHRATTGIHWADSESGGRGRAFLTQPLGAAIARPSYRRAQNNSERAAVESQRQLTGEMVERWSRDRALKKLRARSRVCWGFFFFFFFQRSGVVGRQAAPRHSPAVGFTNKRIATFLGPWAEFWRPSRVSLRVVMELHRVQCYNIRYNHTADPGKVREFRESMLLLLSRPAYPNILAGTFPAQPPRPPRSCRFPAPTNARLADRRHRLQPATTASMLAEILCRCRVLCCVPALAASLRSVSHTLSSGTTHRSHAPAISVSLGRPGRDPRARRPDRHPDPGSTGASSARPKPAQGTLLRIAFVPGGRTALPPGHDRPSAEHRS